MAIIIYKNPAAVHKDVTRLSAGRHLAASIDIPIPFRYVAWMFRKGQIAIIR